MALEPPQPPEAVHEFALVELHVSVEATLLATLVGLAVSVTVGAGTTVTVAVAALLVPPVPVQVKEYEAVEVSAPVPWVPLVAFVPPQPPEALHEVAFVELHASVEPAPLAIEVGLAVSVTVGVPGTVTVAVATLLVPPAPVQINEYEFVAASVPVLCAPLVAFVPPQPPEAVQDVAFVEVHVNVEALPPVMEVGFAVSVTVGMGTTVTVAVATLLVPPGPAHDNEYEPGIVRGPVLCVPVVALMPPQFPEAVHEAALVEVHLSVEAPPIATEVGFADSVTVGAGATVTTAVATLLTPPAPVHINE